jgi:hypothetical protein
MYLGRFLPVRSSFVPSYAPCRVCGVDADGMDVSLASPLGSNFNFDVHDSFTETAYARGAGLCCVLVAI